jgi:hypothetical protein
MSLSKKENQVPVKKSTKLDICTTFAAIYSQVMVKFARHFHMTKCRFFDNHITLHHFYLNPFLLRMSPVGSRTLVPLL